MADREALSAVEALVLLQPQRSRGPAVVKLAMLALLAQGTLAVVSESAAGFLGRRRITVTLRPGPGRWREFPGAQTLMTLVGQGCTMRQFVERARRQYGTALRGYVEREVRPALQRRGLLEPATEKLFGLFPRRVWRLTAAGGDEVGRIDRAIAEAKTIPDWLDRDPAQAAALAATLGTAILLVEELKPHYQRLSQAMRDRDSADGSGGDLTTLFAGDGSRTGETQPDFFCPGDFDFAAFDALDGGFDAFDAGFADAGGDGGGGDGGDGGGDGGGSGC